MELAQCGVSIRAEIGEHDAAECMGRVDPRIGLRNFFANSADSQRLLDYDIRGVGRAKWAGEVPWQASQSGAWRL